jgi:uncharacterized protein YndB with AHSA1/START domain
MIGAKTEAAGVATYELAITIEAPRERVWRAFFEDINTWWLPDFHMTGQGSTVSFEPRAGAQLIETHPDGGSLLWYTIQWIDPKSFTLHVSGHVAPDWGGPATSMIAFAIEEGGTPNSCVLRMSDAHHGRIDEKNLRSLHEGWTQLFTDGLKSFVEG